MAESDGQIRATETPTVAAWGLGAAAGAGGGLGRRGRLPQVVKAVTWDSGVTWDDPNLRWGDLSYLLEPGDPGYVNTAPALGAHPPKKGTKTINETPENQKVLLALAKEMRAAAASPKTDAREELATLLDHANNPKSNVRVVGDAFLETKSGTRASSDAVREHLYVSELEPDSW